MYDIFLGTKQHRIKVGDVVEVISVDSTLDDHEYRIGERYVVGKVSDIRSSWCIIKGVGMKYGMYSYHFKLVNYVLDIDGDVLRPGDKVICVSPSFSLGLFVGKEYKIIRVTDTAVQSDRLVVLDDNVWHCYPARFKLIKEKLVANKIVCNGVDGNGQPLHFTNNMLEPLMRVILANTEIGIVVERCGEKLICLDSGCLDVILVKSADPLWRITEVYDAPGKNGGGYRLLQPAHRGRLIWKSNPTKTAQQIAVDELEDVIKEATEKLSILKGIM